jgi:hypothetical protein
MIIIGIISFFIIFMLGFIISCFLISEEGEDK